MPCWPPLLWSSVGNEYSEVLYNTGMMVDLATDRSWTDHFWSHFLVVSVIVYLVLLFTVLIGTAIPAVKIIRTKITNALRDE